MSLKFQLLTYKEEAANASTPEKIILRTQGNITLKAFSTMPGTGSLNVSCYGCVPDTMLNVLCLPAHWILTTPGNLDVITFSKLKLRKVSAFPSVTLLPRGRATVESSGLPDSRTSALTTGQTVFGCTGFPFLTHSWILMSVCLPVTAGGEGWYSTYNIRKFKKIDIFEWPLEDSSPRICLSAYLMKSKGEVLATKAMTDLMKLEFLKTGLRLKDVYQTLKMFIKVRAGLVYP